MCTAQNSAVETDVENELEGPDPNAVMDGLGLSRAQRERVRKRADKLHRKGRFASHQEAMLEALREYVHRWGQRAA